MSAFDLARHASLAAASPALVLEDEVVSFGELHRRALAFRRETAGTPLVAFVARPTGAALSFTCAMLASGVAILPVHPRFTDTERSAMLARFPDAVFFSEDDLERLMRDSSEGPPLGSPADDERLCAILSSSGTTGIPKGVLLSRRAFAASARASAENLGWTASDRWLLSMPFSHAGGLSIVSRCLSAGRPIVVQPRFDPDRTLCAIERDQVSLLSVVPSMLAALIEHDRENTLARLRAMLVGGAGCPPGLIEVCRERGIPALTTYGLTETCSQVTTQALARPATWTARDSGVSLSGIVVRVVDAEGREIIGEEGRVLVGGSTLMTGYAGGEPLALGATIDTGDIGLLDDRGRLTLSGRADDLIVTGGENVSPVEVELVLRSVDGVIDALVVGIPDPRWGQVVAALLVLRSGQTGDHVLAAVKGALAPFKLPRRMREVAALPLGITGKADRQAARALFSS